MENLIAHLFSDLSIAIMVCFSIISFTILKGLKIHHDFYKATNRNPYDGKREGDK